MAYLTLLCQQALVESHKYHATESIDDVIQGKGKGLVGMLAGLQFTQSCFWFN